MARIRMEDEVAQFKAVLAVPWFLIHPEGGFMQRWDGVTTLALLFTAVVTPFEVAVMDSKEEFDWDVIHDDGLFWANQAVNLIFFADMFFTFFVMFREESAKGYALVRSLPQIQRNYLRGWFALDLVSVVPFAWIPGASKLGALRMIRVLRLLKLMRVLRASRIYKRFQARNSLPHATETMIKQVVTLFMMAHWMACAWVLTGTLQDPAVWTWVDAYAETYVCPSEGCSMEPYRNELLTQPSRLYFGALYWSVVSTTSVGYGDITARNPEEMLLCTVYLLMAAIIWANIVGNIVAVISSGDPDLANHYQMMDKLNNFIVEQNLPKALGLRMRTYFNSR
jgi:potassium voltage-gated channel Eag-related subfamily H protein 7